MGDDSASLNFRDDFTTLHAPSIACTLNFVICFMFCQKLAFIRVTRTVPGRKQFKLPTDACLSLLCPPFFFLYRNFYLSVQCSRVEVTMLRVYLLDHVEVNIQVLKKKFTRNHFKTIFFKCSLLTICTAVSTFILDV